MVTPTPEQREAIATYGDGIDLVLQAGAGCGKSSTLKLIAASDPRRSMMYVAYNRMTTVTPCRGHGRLYDIATNPRGPTARRHQARIAAAALCSRCPIAGSCEERITPPTLRTLRKAAMSAEPITPVPAPQLVPPATPDAPLSTDQLIVWGANHNSSRYQALAGKASAALADLRRAYEQAGKVADAEARIKRLRAQLANAERDLAAAKGTKPKTTAGPTVDYTAVRAWAAEQGIPVGPTGRPRREVVDAYLAAQKAA